MTITKYCKNLNTFVEFVIDYSFPIFNYYYYYHILVIPVTNFINNVPLSVFT